MTETGETPEKKINPADLLNAENAAEIPPTKLNKISQKIESLTEEGNLQNLKNLDQHLVENFHKKITQKQITTLLDHTKSKITELEKNQENQKKLTQYENLQTFLEQLSREDHLTELTKNTLESTESIESLDSQIKQMNFAHRLIETDRDLRDQTLTKFSEKLSDETSDETPQKYTIPTGEENNFSTNLKQILATYIGLPNSEQITQLYKQNDTIVINSETETITIAFGPPESTKNSHEIEIQKRRAANFTEFSKIFENATLETLEQNGGKFLLERDDFYTEENIEALVNAITASSQLQKFEEFAPILAKKWNEILRNEIPNPKTEIALLSQIVTTPALLGNNKITMLASRETLTTGRKNFPDDTKKKLTEIAPKIKESMKMSTNEKIEAGFDSLMEKFGDTFTQAMERLGGKSWLLDLLGGDNAVSNRLREKINKKYADHFEFDESEKNNFSAISKKIDAALEGQNFADESTKKDETEKRFENYFTTLAENPIFDAITLQQNFPANKFAAILEIYNSETDGADFTISNFLEKNPDAQPDNKSSSKNPQRKRKENIENSIDTINNILTSPAIRDHILSEYHEVESSVADLSASESTDVQKELKNATGKKIAKIQDISQYFAAFLAAPERELDDTIRENDTINTGADFTDETPPEKITPASEFEKIKENTKKNTQENPIQLKKPEWEEEITKENLQNTLKKHFNLGEDTKLEITNWSDEIKENFQSDKNPGEKNLKFKISVTNEDDSITSKDFDEKIPLHFTRRSTDPDEN